MLLSTVNSIFDTKQQTEGTHNELLSIVKSFFSWWRQSRVLKKRIQNLKLFGNIIIIYQHCVLFAL